MDKLNEQDGPLDGIDRHACVAHDVNHDGIPDIACLVGANKGTGLGHAELCKSFWMYNLEIRSTHRELN